MVITLSALEYEVKLLKELVSIKSITGNSEEYKRIANLISKELTALGLRLTIHDGEKEAKDGISRPNIVAYYDAGAPRTIGFLTHYDVVSTSSKWREKAFSLRIYEENGEKRASGRGSADDKGCIAALMGAIRDIITRKLELDWNIAFICTADEEIGGEYGAGYIARNKLVELDALVVLDSSSMGLVVGTSGIVHGNIVIKGKPGHAGYLFGSDNALHKAIVFLNELLGFVNSRAMSLSKLRNPPSIPIPNVWGRFSLTWIKSDNMTYNVIPGKITVGFDMRLLPEEDPEFVLSQLKSYFEMTKYRLCLHDIKLEIIRAFPGYMTDENHPFVKKAMDALYKATGKKLPVIGMLGGNDGGWFRDYGIPIISFGVWDEKSNIHGDNESVSLKKIEELKSFIINLVRK